MSGSRDDGRGLRDEGHKRKREDGGGGSSHHKRPNQSDNQQAGLKEIIRVVFDHHKALDQCVSSSGDPAPLTQAYEALLQTATGPYCATRRLAARLVPRFVHLFPQRVDAAAVALMALYTCKEPAQDAKPELVELTQRDALVGLNSILDIAYKLVDKAVPTVLRLVDFQMRLVQAHKQAPTSNHSSDADRSRKDAGGSPPLRPPELLVLQQLIQRTFQLFPRVVLSVCLQAFKGTDTALMSSAVWLLQDQLLAHKPEAHGQPATGTTQGDECDGATPPCLAQLVLADLPDTQTWLRAAINSVNKVKLHASPELAGGVTAVMQQLLQLAAPASPAPPPAPPPPTHPPPASETPPLPPPGAAAAGPGQASSAQPPSGPSPAPGSLPPQQLPPAAGGSRQGRPGNGFTNGPPPDRPHTPAAPEQPPLPGAAGVMSPPPPLPTTLLTPLPVKGGPICRADCCLHLSNLPPSLTPSQLKAACAKFGPVDSVHMGAGVQLPTGEALVVFTNVQIAAMSAEKLSAEAPWEGGRPARVEFCVGLPADCPMRSREGPGRPASCWIWCGVPVPPETLWPLLQQAGLPLPTGAFSLAGGMPGMLLSMTSPELCQQAVEVLISRLLPGHQPPPFTLPPALQQPAPQQALPSQGSLLAPPQQSDPAHTLSRTASIHQQLTSQGSLPGHAPSWQQQQQEGVVGLRTLWVGQLHDSVNEEVLQAAFRRFGDLHSCKVIRASHCAFVDFITHAAAAEALKGMKGAKLAGQMIRVEWKQDIKQQQQQQAAAGQHTPMGQYPRTPAPPHGLQPTLGGPAHTPASLMSMGPYMGGPQHTPGMPTPGAFTPQGSGQLPMHLNRTASLHQQDQRPGVVPPPAPPPGAPPQPVLTWQGDVAKSGVAQGVMVCMPPEPGTQGSREPQGWPPVLNVQLRSETKYVAQCWNQTPPHMRAARRLQPAGADAKLADFVKYLAGKDRAGVIKVDAADGLPARTIYLSPPSAKLGQLTGLSYEAKRDAACLIAVVVPTKDAQKADQA